MIIILPCYLFLQVTSYMRQYIFIFKIERVCRTFKHIHSIYNMKRPNKRHLIYIYVHYHALLVNIKFICTRIPITWGVLDTTLYDKVCQWLTAGRWFSQSTPDSSINTTDYHDIAEILLNVTLNTRHLNLNLFVRALVHTIFQGLWFISWYSW
jgi:hypothetical protein